MNSDDRDPDYLYARQFAYDVLRRLLVARREILHYQARNSALRGMVKSAHFALCKIDSIFLAI